MEKEALGLKVYKANQLPNKVRFRNEAGTSSYLLVKKKNAGGKVVFIVRDGGHDDLIQLTQHDLTRKNMLFIEQNGSIVGKLLEVW